MDSNKQINFPNVCKQNFVKLLLQLSMQLNQSKRLIVGLFGALLMLSAVSQIHSQSILDTTFNPNVNNAVNAIVVQSNGKILIGGQFSSVGGQLRFSIARLNANGTLDTAFNPNVNNAVNAIAVQADGKILIGGQFNDIGGQPRKNIARLNEDGTLDTAFNPNVNNAVNAIAVQSNGKILIGGNFTTVGGQLRNSIARLNADGTLDTAFNSNLNITNIGVRAIAVQTDGKILIGGNFTSVGGQPRNNIARLNADGMLDTTFSLINTNVIYAIVVQTDGKILIGGFFTSVGSVMRNSIARLNADGTLDTGFNPNANNFVLAITVQSNGKILIGGNFTSIGGQPRIGIARLNADGTLDTGFNLNANGTFYTIVVQADGKILVGGSFTSVGGQPRNNIARLNADLTNSCVPIPINFGQTFSNALSSNSCVTSNRYNDTYIFLGNAGDQIAITMDAAFFPTLELINPQGSVIQTVGGGDSDRSIRLPASQYYTLLAPGTYTIRASSNFQGTGAYRLSLYKAPPASTPCTYSLSSPRTNVPSGGGTFFIDVVTQSGCPPLIASNPFGQIYSITSYSGGRLTFLVRPNLGTTDLQATITIAGLTQLTHTIYQYANVEPTNNPFAGAFTISGINSPANAPITGYNTNATAEPLEPPHDGKPAARSVWYKWTSPANGLYSFSTSGSSFDTVMNIYVCPLTGACSLTNITSVGSNDDTRSFDKTSKVNFRAVIGRTYYIAIDGKRDAAGVVATGTIQLSWRQYERLYRLYLQSFNGNPSPQIPDRIYACNGSNIFPVCNGNSVTAMRISQGVYEFNLPADNTAYKVNISGPNGIVWNPNNFPLDTSFSLLNELMEGPAEGGQNTTTNAQNSVPKFFIGYIKNITSLDLQQPPPTPQNPSLLSVTVGYSRGANPLPPDNCLINSAPVTFAGISYARYQCKVEPNTLHDFVPNREGKRFNVSVYSAPGPLPNDNSEVPPEVAMVAEDAPTYKISGRVLAGGQNTTVDLSYLPLGNAQRISLSTKTIDANGNYEFRNLAENRYQLKATRTGFVFNVPPEINLTATRNNENITAQTCAYTIPASRSYGSGGGSDEFSVTATTSQGCEWTAERDSAWITINSGSSVGNGRVQFTVQPNNGVERQGTIRVGEQAFTVSQANGCTYTVVPTGGGNIPTFPAAGGMGSFTVTASNGGCPSMAVTSDYCMISLSGSATIGTLNYTVANNLGVARTATITLGGQTFTINQAAAPGTHRTRFDFDGDGKADIAVYRPSDGGWYLQQSTAGFTGVAFGVAEDIPVAADYDGDGKTDIAVYRPSNGVWYLQRSTAGFIGVAFGVTNDIPQPADFDNDGKAELAIFRPSNGTWYTFNLTTNLSNSVAFGQNGDKPVVGDYDGDRKADYAVYRSGTWYIQQSTLSFTSIAFGVPTDKPMPADYDGDGKTDVAVFRPSNGTWYLQQSMAGFAEVAFGTSGDIPVAADYNGDKKADVAVFRPSNGTWYILSCTNQSQFNGTPFGFMTDIPVENPNTP